MHIVIMLDGADPKYANMYFKRIKELGKINNTNTGMNTGQSVGTVLTGLNPDEHGFQGLGMESDLNHIKGKVLWEKMDCSFGTANVPLVWPPKPINGWHVCGMLAPSNSIYTYPAELTEELNKMNYEIWASDYPDRKIKNTWRSVFGYFFKSYLPHFFDSPLEALKNFTYSNIKTTFQAMRTEEVVYASTPYIDPKWWDREWKRVIKKRTDAFIYLLNNYPVDVVLLCYKALDSIQHRFMHLPEKIKEWYELQDEEIGKLLDGLKVKPESVSIFSDHGFERKERGYLTGDHRPIGIFVSTKENNVKNLVDLHNFILGLKE